MNVWQKLEQSIIYYYNYVVFENLCVQCHPKQTDNFQPYAHMIITLWANTDFEQSIKSMVLLLFL